MKIFLRDQRLAPWMDHFKALELSLAAGSEIAPKIVRECIGHKALDLREVDLSFLFYYQIFPPEILTFCAQWQLENRKMREGDTIVIEAYMPPSKWALKLIFGVRVLSVFLEAQRAGFSYGTLAGHPECGTNEFAIISDGGGVFSQVKTKARPASILGRVTAPVLAEPYVDYSNRKAATRIRENFLKVNATPFHQVS